MARQQVGTGGSPTHAEALLAPAQGLQGIDQVRQHHDLRLHQQARGHQVERPVLASVGPLALVHSARDRAVSSSCPGSGQSTGGFSVTTEIRSEGVVSAPVCSEQDLRKVGQTQHRSVCVGTQPQTERVLHAVSEPSGSLQRCFLDLMGKFLHGVRLPPNHSASQSVAEGSPGSGPASPHSALVAQEELVRRHPQYVDGYSSASSRMAGSVVAVSGASSELQPVQAGGLEDKRSFLRTQGFSEEAITTIQGSRAQSTLALYDGKWEGFKRWCSARHLDPHATTVAQIIDFLQSLFKDGLAHSTIRGYVAAIGAYHSQYHEKSLGKVVYIRDFLKGVFRLRPPIKDVVPTWELSVVLQALMEHPFEPPETATLKAWTWKTCFLLAITSAARVSELYSIDSHPDLTIIRKGSVTIRLNPAFMPKVPNMVYLNRTIQLQAFKPNARSKKDIALQSLCPIRALRYYLDKTQEIRQERRLFVSYKHRHEGDHIEVATLSRWIKETICFGYKQQGKKPPKPSIKPHTTRAMAASFADLRGVGAVDLCRAATWSDASVFAKFYRLDVAAEEGISTHVLAAAVAARQDRVAN